MSEQRLCFKALVGSYNYNLQTEHSDKDYKIFFYPTFDELYEGGQYSKAMVSDEEDVEYHDIRKLPQLVYKSNVNFLEVLFSEEYEVYDDVLFNKLIELRDDIATMNVPYLYDACFGMYMRKMKEYERDKEHAPREKTYKHVMVAYRILDFLERFSKLSFSSFKRAIQYENSDRMRNTLFDIRNGAFPFSLVEEWIGEKVYNIKNLEAIYYSFEVNKHIKQKLDDIVKERVKEVLKETI